MKLNAIKTMVLVGMLFSHQAFSAPSEATITQYNQAAQGDEDLVEVVYEQLQMQLEQQGVNSLGLVYLGSTETLMGRDAFLPWNKMKHTEQGLSTISKGLELLHRNPVPLQDQVTRQGVPETVLARAIAASTFTSLPDMFNHFERGYDIYLELIIDDQFVAQQFDNTSWIYLYAVKAALRAEDIPQAKRWLKEMQKKNDKDPMTLQASLLINEQS